MLSSQVRSCTAARGSRLNGSFNCCGSPPLHNIVASLQGERTGFEVNPKTSVGTADAVKCRHVYSVGGSALALRIKSLVSRPSGTIGSTELFFCIYKGYSRRLDTISLRIKSLLGDSFALNFCVSAAGFYNCKFSLMNESSFRSKFLR